jgi:protein SCO1/2
MNIKSWIAGMIAIVALVSIATALLFLNRGPVFRGNEIQSPKPANEINLPDSNGNTFQLSAQRGKVVLIYFGFVNCPDECPLTMAIYKQALELLGDSAGDVQVVLVSTDPVRDTPQAMQEYLAKFNHTFIGIPGTSQQLQKIWNDYGVMVLDGGETHSGFTYVIDRKGFQRMVFLPETSAEDIAHDLKILLAEE